MFRQQTTRIRVLLRTGSRETTEGQTHRLRFGPRPTVRTPEGKETRTPTEREMTTRGEKVREVIRKKNEVRTEYLV